MPSLKPTRAKGKRHDIRKPAFGALLLQAGKRAGHQTNRPQWRLRTHSTLETERLGQLAGSAARGGEVLALSGDLGTGKTCFVRGIAAGLSASRSAVSSPTFVFIHEYRGRLRLAHADLFRLESASACRDLGLSDYLNDKSVVAVEWPEKAERELPWDRLDVQLIHKGKTVRELRFQAHGTDSVAFLTRLRGLASRTAQESCFAQPARRTRRADPK